ncbi:hypothetical protein AK812_SmicGene13749 [Symbiodinium microadriaticum]|uniref:Uncharacterized protein n=1 Tax=Symbiodinium microadriaticum TaxID=2951 RepID=A0A1Q9E7C9_SYMMI|nr:hypothetical protein AK812_SmicGene13749 [Symbiodinium microadriaticum]
METVATAAALAGRVDGNKGQFQSIIACNSYHGSHESTATFEMLRRIPSEALSHAGPEEQELRCKLLRGATIVFFSAGYPGK